MLCNCPCRRLTPRLFVPYMLAALMLAGCGTTPPSSFYTLTPLAEAADRDTDIQGGGLSIGIGPVVFPQYLDRPQLVVRGGTNRLDLDEFQRWGGTVQDDFLRVWGENLAHLLDTSRIVIFPTESRMPIDFRITAEVISFAAAPGGEVVLKVRWAVMDSYLEQTLAAREDVYLSPVVSSPQVVGAPAGDAGQQAGAEVGGYESEAVVAAMSRVLGEFSRDVAGVLRTLPKPPPPPEATVRPL
jgi:uncharacterized lipoprotein YmbA